MERFIQHRHLEAAGGRDQEGGAGPRGHGRGVQRQHHQQVSAALLLTDSIMGVISNSQTAIKDPCSGRSFYIAETLTDFQTDGARLEQEAFV